MPQGKIRSIGASGNDRLGRLLVKEGQHVEPGETLAYLESYAERLAARDYAESQVLDAKARLTAETAYGKSNIAEAKLRVRQFKELPLLDIRAQEAKIRQLEADLAGEEKDLKCPRHLQKKGTISQQDVDHQILTVNRIQEELNSTAAALVKLKAAYDVNLLMTQIQLKTTQANMTRAQAAVQVQSLTKNLALAQAHLSRAILKAPIRGRVLQIFIRQGETIGTQPVLTIGNTEHMQAVAEVYETDIRLVRVGQRATASSPALTNVLTGTVIHIGSTIAKNDIRVVPQ